MSHRRVATIRGGSGFVILETKTSHLSLDILNHFPALDVSGHYKVTALLLYICDCVLMKQTEEKVNHLGGKTMRLMITSRENKNIIKY